MTHIDVAHSNPIALAFAAWLWINALPFSAIGIAFIVISQALEHNPHLQRRLFALVNLALGLLVVTSAAAVGHHYYAVIYDYCSSPDIPWWLWLLDCAVR